MSKASRITTVRVILTFLIILILVFPYYQVGISVPTYIFNNVLIDMKYIIAGVLFIIACILDFVDNYVAVKERDNELYTSMFDEIAGRLLINSLLIILACNGMISLFIAVAIVVRDIIVDKVKLYITSSKELKHISFIVLAKDIILMIGLALTLFYNMPFALLDLYISDFLLIVATVLAVLSATKYYVVAKKGIIRK